VLGSNMVMYDRLSAHGSTWLLGWPKVSLTPDGAALPESYG
jgi:hypothetical protein